MIKIVFITVLAIILIFYLYKKNRQNKSTHILQDLIKDNYIKVTVPIDKLNIITREYYEEIQEDRWPSRINVIDIFYRKIRKRRSKDRYLLFPMIISFCTMIAKL